MLKKILPVLMALIGVAIGGGAGIFLRPAEEVAEGETTEKAKAETPEETAEPTVDYVKMPNQFIVPVVLNGKVTSVVVLSLTLEVKAGTNDAVMAKEPKLRDAFLQMLFDHANAGGFRGSFTEAANLNPLRKALFEIAQTTLPDIVTDVLIAEISRQDA